MGYTKTVITCKQSSGNVLDVPIPIVEKLHRNSVVTIVV